jgi:hypothetical protein
VGVIQRQRMPIISYNSSIKPYIVGQITRQPSPELRTTNRTRIERKGSFYE